MIPKKSMGQNFLKSRGALSKIIEAGKLTENDVILEIGPGHGALTKELLASPAKKVISIEKDDALFTELHDTFKTDIDAGRFLLIHGDALTFDIDSAETLIPDFDREHYKILANIPYNITGAFIRKYLEAKTQPKTMVILIQKEVAERIVARNGKESLLSISVKVFGQPKIVGPVPRGAFHPVPNVDSAILAIEDISRDRLKEVDEKKFFQILKAGFAHKRKKLRGNLKEALGIDISPKLFDLNLSPDIRAEDLRMVDWNKIAQI